MSYEISVGKMNRTTTLNVSPLWDRAMPNLNLKDMHGKTAEECLPHLESGAIDMVRNKSRYFLDEIGTARDWLHFSDALSVLVEMAHECRHNPTGKVFVYTKTGQA